MFSQAGPQKNARRRSRARPIAEPQAGDLLARNAITALRVAGSQLAVGSSLVAGRAPRIEVGQSGVRRLGASGVRAERVRAKPMLPEAPRPRASELPVTRQQLSRAPGLVQPHAAGACRRRGVQRGARSPRLATTHEIDCSWTSRCAGRRRARARLMSSCGGTGSSPTTSRSTRSATRPTTIICGPIFSAIRA